MRNASAGAPPSRGRRRRLGACAVLACLAAIAVAPGPARAIVGSSQEGGALASSVVMVLDHVGTRAGFCSAVVLAPTVLLTAAHCVPPGAALKVYLPAEGTAPVLRDVAEVLRNPDYHADAIRTRQRSIDLALLRLPAALPDGFRAATLADDPGRAAVGTAYRLAGFGLTQEGNPRSSGHLRVGRVAARAPLSDVLLWANGPSGACEGDSGGPVTLADRDAVAAVMVWSAGVGAARCGALTQAVWLGPQRGWIADRLRAWGAAP